MTAAATREGHGHAVDQVGHRLGRFGDAWPDHHPRRQRAVEEIARIDPADAAALPGSAVAKAAAGRRQERQVAAPVGDRARSIVALDRPAGRPGAARAPPARARGGGSQLFGQQIRRHVGDRVAEPRVEAERIGIEAVLKQPQAARLRGDRSRAPPSARGPRRAGAPGRAASGPMLVTAPRGCAKPDAHGLLPDQATTHPSGSRSR